MNFDYATITDITLRKFLVFAKVMHTLHTLILTKIVKYILSSKYYCHVVKCTKNNTRKFIVMEIHKLKIVLHTKTFNTKNGLYVDL